MAPGLSREKRRYQELIFQHINDNPDRFMDAEPGAPAAAAARTKPLPAGGGRFGPRREPTETERAFDAGLYDGLTFGLGDELEAGWKSLGAVFDDRAMADVYDAALSEARAEAEYLQQQHPYAFGGGAIVGSVANPITYLPIGWVARGASVAGRAGEAARLARASWNMAEAGAIDGAAYGFNSGEGGLERRLEKAAVEAGTGALVGAALPASAQIAVQGGKLAMSGAQLISREAEAAASAAAAALARHPAEFVPLYKLARKIVDDGGGTIDLTQRLRNTVELLARPNESRIANEIGIQRDALSGKGNFGLGTADEETAMRMAESFLGPGASRASSGPAVVAADKLRQYRFPKKVNNPYTKTGVQANFERRWVPEGAWQSNGHLDIVK